MNRHAPLPTPRFPWSVSTRGGKRSVPAAIPTAPKTSRMTDEEWLAEGLLRAEEAMHFEGPLPTTHEVLAQLQAIT